MRRYDADRVDVVDERRDDSNWTPLLLIPLFLLLGLGALGAYNMFQSDNTIYNQTNDGTQFGVGGAPPLSISPTFISPTPTGTENKDFLMDEFTPTGPTGPTGSESLQGVGIE